MKLSFQLKTPVSTGAPDYIINNQVLNVIPIDNAVSGTFYIDEVSVFFDGSTTYPITGVTSKGYDYSINKDAFHYFNLDLNFGSDVFHELPVRLQIAVNGYYEYDNSFIFYNTDIVDNSSDCLPLSIILINPTNNAVNGVQMQGYSSFYPIRKPFTNLIYLYKNNSSQGTNYYYNDETDELLGVGNNVLISAENDIDLYAINVINANTFVGTTLTSKSLKCIPNFTSELIKVTGDYPDDVNIEIPHTVKTLIDFAGLTKFVTDQNNKYPFDKADLTYRLIDANGTVIDTTSIQIDTNNYPTILNGGELDWSGFVLPTVGDFLIEVILRVVGKPTNNIVSGGALYGGTTYRILNSSNGTSFTGFGAVDNNKFTNGIASSSDEVSPDWQLGDFIELTDPVLIISKRFKISGDNWYKLEQKDEYNYTAYNYSFHSSLLTVYKLDSNKVFQPVSNLIGLTLNSLSNLTINLLNDGIYKFEVEWTDQGTGDTLNAFYIIAHYPNLRTCLLKAIKLTLCAKCCEDCKQKDYYDFNSFVLQVTTYFNMLNSEYNFNYLYTSLDPNKLNELYEMNSILENIQNTCNGVQNCNCGTGSCS